MYLKEVLKFYGTYHVTADRCYLYDPRRGSNNPSCKLDVYKKAEQFTVSKVPSTA